MKFVYLFYCVQLFAFYKYASGVMRQEIGNNCCAFSPRSKPISSYVFRIEELSILFFFFFPPSKQAFSWAAFPSVVSSCKFGMGGHNSNWIEKSTMFHSVTVMKIAWNVHICALTFCIPVQVCCSFHCYSFCPGLNFRIIIHTHRKFFLWLKSLWRGIAEWIQAIFQISVQSYMHTNGEKIAWFDISVKGEWREKGKPGGRREKVEGGKIQSAPVWAFIVTAAIKSIFDVVLN